MYTISKGPNKIVAKTRRGLAPNYEKFETIREISKKSSDVGRAEDFSVPRPVFQANKRALSYSKNQLDDEALTPQHEEIVKYITEYHVVSKHQIVDWLGADPTESNVQVCRVKGARLGKLM